MKQNSSFSAFVMTFNRNKQLEETILSLFKQSIIPEKVLIIDNEPSGVARAVYNKLSHLPLSYHAVGYNSGPAGAAKRGLQILSNEGYDWIAWIDDDDPPLFEDNFEILLTCAKSVTNCGCVGAVGQRYNDSKGLIVRVPDAELDNPGFINVDNVAGNMCKIVSGNFVRTTNIFPDENLFFGYEELDFDLRMKEAGYMLLTDASLYKRYRIQANRIGFHSKRGLKKPQNKLWREYYSARNLLFITKKHNRSLTVFLLMIRFSIKSLIGFRFGLQYGAKNFFCITLAMFHFVINKSGKTILSI